MALELNKQIQVNVGAIVTASVNAVKLVRNQEQSRQESLFQQAVADGISYKSQLEFRKKQLDDLKNQSFVDPAYRSKLEASVASTKKLVRFQKYRKNYSESLAELNAGRINEIEYSDRLKDMLEQTNDVDLQVEIQKNITESETKVTTYKTTLLANKVKKAKYDGTEKTLDEAIELVKEARSSALISGNDDEVEEYDLTIASLNSQKVQAHAEDVIDNIAVSGAMSEFNANEKLKELGTQIEESDFDIPITIGGKRFDSEREYWQITRSAYMTGNGSGIFSDYFGEIDSQYESKINADIAKFGFVNTTTMNTIQGDFVKLRSDPDFAPFLEQIDNMQTMVMSSAVDSMAEVVVDRAQYTGDFTKADATLKTLAATYGVDTSFRQLALGNVLNQQVNASIAAGLGTPDEASLLPPSDLPVPGVGETPVAPTAPGATPTAPGTPSKVGGRYVVQEGDTLSNIATRNNISLAQLLSLNPQHQENPDVIKIGNRLNLGQETPDAPVTEPTTVAPEQVKVENPPVDVPAPTPTPVVQETPTQTPTVYDVISGDTLSSIAARNKTTVDALVKKNKIKNPDLIQVGQKITL